MRLIIDDLEIILTELGSELNSLKPHTKNAQRLHNVLVQGTIRIRVSLDQVQYLLECEVSMEQR